jgi:type II secretory pathway component PulF
VTSSGHGERTPWGLLAVAVSVAVGAFLLLFFLLWKYVPPHAAMLACSGAPTPQLTEFVFFFAKWTVRLLPFLLLMGGPAVLILTVIVGTALNAPNQRRRTARRVILAAAAVAFVVLAACATVAYSMRMARDASDEACLASGLQSAFGPDGCAPEGQ